MNKHGITSAVYTRGQELYSLINFLSDKKKKMGIKSGVLPV